MTPVDENKREPGGDDMVAAEYVLGVLPAEERLAAARRIETDADFARLVETWEQRFSPLSEEFAEVTPPASLKASLDQRLFGRGEQQARPGLWDSLAFWRGLAAASLAALVVYVAVTTMWTPPDAPADQLVASLAAQDSDVHYVAVYDPVHSRVGLSHVSGARASGRDFELWVIDGGAPVSLGVIPVGASVDVSVQRPHRELLAKEDAALAVSLEPEGGSPTGQPTGPVVALGNLNKI
ncbi:anti-sigma factor domain-containing protein [Roseibium salinum]